MWYSYTLTDSHTLHSYTLTDNLDQLCLLSSLISIPVEQFQFLDGASRAGTVHFYTLWKVVIYCGMSKFQKWGISERGTPMLPLCSLTGFMQRGKKWSFQKSGRRPILRGFLGETDVVKEIFFPGSLVSVTLKYLNNAVMIQCVFMGIPELGYSTYWFFIVISYFLIY